MIANRVSGGAVEVEQIAKAVDDVVKPESLAPSPSPCRPVFAGEPRVSSAERGCLGLLEET